MLWQLLNQCRSKDSMLGHPATVPTLKFGKFAIIDKKTLIKMLFL